MPRRLRRVTGVESKESKVPTQRTLWGRLAACSSISPRNRSSESTRAKRTSGRAGWTIPRRGTIGVHPASRRVPCCNPPEVPACPGCMGHLSLGVVRIRTVVSAGEWITRRRGGLKRVLPQGLQEDAESRKGRQRAQPAPNRFPLLSSLRLLRLAPSAISAAPRETKGNGGRERFTRRRGDAEGSRFVGKVKGVGCVVCGRKIGEE